jgi:NAD(P)-dependent dehydrogenase (short-subunit alcohol dehydrogenase family)
MLPEKIDGLVYCPGTINLRPFRSLKPEDFQHDFDVNVLGAIKTLRAAQRPMKKAEQAGVVLYSTVAVSQGMPFHASVATSKAAVEGLVRSLAAEWAPKIRVNCIAPSLTDTPLAAKLLSSEDKRKSGDDRHPLRRVGTAEDIANMTLFLLSSESSWISGQVMAVDGGMSRLRV